MLGEAKSEQDKLKEISKQLVGASKMHAKQSKQVAKVADNLDEAKKFAESIKKDHPELMLAYNCSPSFNWKANLDDATIAKFQRELGAMGYKFQFITLAGIHSMWHGMFDLTKKYVKDGMTAYVELQEKEFADHDKGYTFSAHQQEVGTGYFDAVNNCIVGESSTSAMDGSTEDCLLYTSDAADE